MRWRSGNEGKLCCLSRRQILRSVACIVPQACGNINRSWMIRKWRCESGAGMIAGRAPEYAWRPNPDGKKRSIAEACQIARHWRVVIPDYVSFAVDKYDWLDADTYA